MYRATFGIATVLSVAALLGLAFAPAAAATRYDIDITKTIRGYTIHIVGYVDIDEPARTVSGELHITVTDATGKVLYEKDVTFSFSWGSTPEPITLAMPGLTVTVSFSWMGVSVTATPTISPAQLAAWHRRLSRLE